jgi:Ca2+-binding EF-hand superfamily protein
VHEGTNIFEKADLNKNGFIDFSEFIAASLDINELTTKKKLQTAFQLFDLVRSQIMIRTAMERSL